MNYEDELERARAKRSRRRESSTGSRNRSTGTGAAGETPVRAHSSAHSASARRRKKNNRVKKIAAIVAVVIVLLIAAVVIGAYAYINHHMEKSFDSDFRQEEVENQNIPLEMREKMEKGYWTVAIFGVDSRDNSLGKGNQSDVIMIANLNRATGEIKLVSVFRDTYLNINDRNTYNKINAAYATGGPEAAVKALNKNLDLNITHYATFNWKAVATVINILGGVEIDVSKSEFYYINAFITETVKGTGIGSTQLDAPGTHLLDGVQAVAYGRLRLMDSDYARTERQRIVIQKAFEKAKKADLATLNSVVGHVFEMTKTNIQFGDLAGLVKDINKYHLGESMGFPAARGEERMKIGSNNLSCVIPQTLESNVISLHKFLYDEDDYTPSATVQEISKKIAELSGLSKAGQEIGHVATDKGYVPKATTTAAADTTAASTAESSESQSGTETSEGESEASSEGESGSESPGESQPESGSIIERPMESTEYGPHSTTEEHHYGPGGPSSTTAASPGGGPGSTEGRIPEATTATPGTEPSSPSDKISVIVPSTAAQSSTAAPSGGGPSAPSSPADMTSPAAGGNGPASQATAPVPSAPQSAPGM